MPALTLALDRAGDAFAANRRHTLDLIEQWRAHRGPHARREREGSAAVRQARPAAAARARRAPARSRRSLPGAVDARRLAPGRRRRRALGPRRRHDLRHRRRRRAFASSSSPTTPASTPARCRRRACEKLLRAQQIALENRLPFVHLVESAGANLLKYRVEQFVRGGALFCNLARLSAAGLPVIAVVHGSSTAGGAYMTGLSDHVIMVRGRATRLPRRAAAAEGRDRRDRDRRGARRRRHACAACRASPSTSPTTTRARSRPRAS